MRRLWITIVVALLGLFVSATVVRHWRDQNTHTVLAPMSARVSALYPSAQVAARLIVSQSVAHSIFQHVLPLTFPTTGDKASAVDLVFCGGQGAGAKMLILVTPGIAAKSKVPVLDRKYCAMDLAAAALEIAKGYSDPSALVASTLEWTPWQLSTSVTSSTPVHPSQTMDTNLAHDLRSGTIVGQFNTRGMSTRLPNGTDLRLDGQIGFAGERMYVSLLASPAPTQLQPSYVTDGDLEADENLDVRLPIALFNSLSTDQFGTKPFSLSPNGFNSLALNSPLLEQDTSGLHSTAIISLAAFGDFDFDVTWTGQDLAVTQVKIAPKLAQCAATDSGCEGRNTQLRNMADVYARNLTTQFRGNLLRPNDWTHGIDVTLFGAPLHLNLQNNRSTLVGNELKFVDVVSVDMGGSHENH